MSHIFNDLSAAAMVFDFANQAQMPTKPAPKKRGRKKKPKKWSKPEGMPKRPLSAYNIFFATERQRLLDEQQLAREKVVEDWSFEDLESPEKGKGGIGFASLARTVASKWRTSTIAEKKPFYDEAAKEQDRYKIAVKEWQDRGLDPRKSCCKAAVVPATVHDLVAPMGFQGYIMGRTPAPTTALIRQVTDEIDPTAAPPSQQEGSVRSVSLPRRHGDDLLREVSSRAQTLEPVSMAFNWNDGLKPSTAAAMMTEEHYAADLEPIPFDYSKCGSKAFGGVVTEDYRALSARLIRELNSTLDRDQVGLLLNSTFARSA